MSNAKVKCPNCEESILKSFYGSDDELVGYLCEDGIYDEYGSGCNKLVTSDDYKEYKSQLPSQSQDDKNAISSRTSSTASTPRLPIRVTSTSTIGSPLTPRGSMISPLTPRSSIMSPNSNPGTPIQPHFTRTPTTPLTPRSSGANTTTTPLTLSAQSGFNTTLSSPHVTSNRTQSRPVTGGISGIATSRPAPSRRSGVILSTSISSRSSKKSGNKSDNEEFDDECLSDSSDDGGDLSEDEIDYPSSQQMNEDYQANSFAMASGNVEVQRVPMVTGLGLNVKGCELIDRHKKPFMMPSQDPRIAKQLFDPTRVNRQMGINRYSMKYLTGKGNGGFVPLNAASLPLRPGELPDVKPLEDMPVVDKGGHFTIPPDFEPLVVWEPSPEDLALVPTLTSIEVPPRIARWLRPHQREGVQFLSECVLEQRDFSGQGAILADDMGLGKTLQSVALIYALLMQGFEVDTPVARKIIVCCPTSLVANWANEFTKWIGPDIVNVIALTDSNRDAVEHGIEKYVSATQGVQVMVISYDTFRRHVRRILRRDCDLLVCDEAHRLKNRETETYKTLARLQCRRRVLLSGTPMQNCLAEFYAMVDFTNPGVLGDEKDFNRYYQGPILRGREPDASDRERKKGEEMTEKLSSIVNMFILRRTNVLLSQHLPPKVIEIVCCALSPLQKAIYKHLVNQAAVKKMLAESEGCDLLELDDTEPTGKEKDKDKSNNGGGGGNGGRVQVLPLIGALKNLCNHPRLLWDVKDQIKIVGAGDELAKLYPPDFHNNSKELGFHPKYSGKMAALDKLLCTTKATTDDKFVLVSNYTQTLDLFEELCVFRGWNYLRVDGSTTVKRRQELVDLLNKPNSPVYIFLLSSKAGGCGLNMVGANRLVLFDPDWNPAVDKQAAARVWRDGQKKRCFVYRFFASGTIDEKIYQRQLSKEGLADVMGGNNTEASVSSEDLRDLFTYNESTLCDTHDTLECECLQRLALPPSPHPSDNEDNDEMDEDDDSTSKLDADAAESARFARERLRKKKLLERANRPRLLWGQRGRPTEEDLGNWSHHCSVRTVPDPAFRLTHSSTFKEPPKPKPGSAKNLNLGASSSSRKPSAPVAPIRASARLLANQPVKEVIKPESSPTVSISLNTMDDNLPSPDNFDGVDGKKGDKDEKNEKNERKTPTNKIGNGLVATVSPLKGYNHNPVLDPVVFVFACEVIGKAVTGRVEAENKRVSCMVEEDAVLTIQERRQEERTKVAKIELEKQLLEQQQKLLQEQQGQVDENGVAIVPPTPTTPESNSSSSNVSNQSSQNTPENDANGSMNDITDSVPSTPKEKNDPNKNKIVMGPRSRLPLHLRPLEETKETEEMTDDITDNTQHTIQGDDDVELIDTQITTKLEINTDATAIIELSDNEDKSSSHDVSQKSQESVEGNESDDLEIVSMKRKNTKTAKTTKGEPKTPKTPKTPKNQPVDGAAIEDKKLTSAKRKRETSTTDTPAAKKAKTPKNFKKEAQQIVTKKPADMDDETWQLIQLMQMEDAMN